MPLSVPVWDFMDRNFSTISPESTLGEALEAMDEATKAGSHARSLVVINENGEYVGVISMRNILDAFKPEFSSWLGLFGKDGWDESLRKGLQQCNVRKVKDYMVKVPALKMSDDLVKAFKILTERGLEVRAVPVVEAGKVEGVVHIPDLFDIFVEAYRKYA
ncbi:MAG: CBS domain-containing protein [Pseudomonadota bacterium]